MNGEGFPHPTWLIGCGNMAGAIVQGWQSAGVDLSKTVAIRPSGKPVEGVRTVTSVRDAGPAPAMIMLGFKPQQLDEVTPDLIPWITSRTIVLSILAGAEAASLRNRFPKGKIVRAMPNLPVAVRRGVTALYSEETDEKLRERIGGLFSVLGFAMWTNTEQAFGTIGSVAGAGPAYVSRFIAALSEAGVRDGLSEELASTLALETVFGTAWMAAATGEAMDALARRVASPNGTTEAGLKVLDSDSRLDRLVADTIEAASRRSRELAAESRRG